MKKYKFNIHNLSCANCALKVEDELKKCADYQNVAVNFSTSVISLESDTDVDLKQLRNIVKSVEADVVVTSMGEDYEKNSDLGRLVLASLFFILSLCFTNFSLISEILMIVSYTLFLYRPFVAAVNIFLNSKTLNENALITISCLGAYLVDQKAEGAMVIFLYTIGKILEDKAVNKSRSSIKELMEIKQDYANLILDDRITTVDVDLVKEGDVLLVKKGEKIPVDGVVLNGETSLDMSSLTGESQKVLVGENDEVLSGSINLDNVIEFRATKSFENSTVSKILELITEGTNKKAKIENTVTKISKVYTPLVLFLSVIVVLFLSLFTQVGFDVALYRGLTFLVIACPCAMAISVPLAYFTGIGVCSRDGVLVKGSNYLDAFSKMNKIVFDKTGTITKGSWQIAKVDILNSKYQEEDLMKIVAAGEAFSNHPLAKLFSSIACDKKLVKNFREVTGKGIKFQYENKYVMIGANHFCKVKESGASIYVTINHKLVAAIYLDDGIKENVVTSLNDFKKRDIKTYLFTGDKLSVTQKIVGNLEFDCVKAELLPQDKFHLYEEIHESGDLIAFVGDGINDAPLLKRADVGISMGIMGADVAISASDVVIMNDDILKINKAIDISKKTNKIIKENLSFAIFTKVLILVLSVWGLSSMWMAVFADTGVTLLTILNTLRINKK